MAAGSAGSAEAGSEAAGAAAPAVEAGSAAAGAAAGAAGAVGADYSPAIAAEEEARCTDCAACHVLGCATAGTVMPMSSWLHSSCEIDKITDDTTMGAITDGIADWCAAAFRKKELGIPVRKNNVRLVHVHTGPTGRVVLSPLHPEDTAASVDLFNIAHLASRVHGEAQLPHIVGETTVRRVGECAHEQLPHELNLFDGFTSRPGEYVDNRLGEPLPPELSACHFTGATDSNYARAIGGGLLTPSTFIGFADMLHLDHDLLHDALDYLRRSGSVLAHVLSAVECSMRPFAQPASMPGWALGGVEAVPTTYLDDGGMLDDTL
ncbi:hypothetical protein T492DRAFT_878996 [Pavlovales sp. CCMP2436]|nr:hypothetical protein T492DRAFT_878996 [Pavlovales sp. CCMP2436]